MRSGAVADDRREGRAMSILKPSPMPLPTFTYEFHELANEYPLIEGDEFDNLVEDIRKHGIFEPIVLFEGKILDGRDRYRAGKEAGHSFTARDFKDLLLSIDPEEFVSSKNDHRRNLDTKQKRALIERKINRHPDRSDKAIAKLVCCDRKTVASVRDEMKKKVETLTKGWSELSTMQRQEFVAGKRGEILTALGISPA
jgi:hypothetical protein